MTVTDQAPSGPLAALAGIWQRNQDLLRNAGSLAATTGMTSLFGVVYWILAAREFSQGAVGYGSAAISAMTLLGTVGMFGLGSMLIGELPKRTDRGGLLTASLAAALGGSLFLGLLFPVVTIVFRLHFPQVSGTPLRVAVFAAGVAVTGASLVFDSGTIGLMRGGLQMSRNLAMSFFKLLLLPAIAVVLHDAFGLGIVMAWTLGTVLSLIPVIIMIRRSGSRLLHRPDWPLLRSLGKVAMAHNWLNLAIATPPKLIPVIVTMVVSPSANGAYYVAFMIASFLFMVPAHLSTVLFAVVSAAPEVIGEKLRFVMRLSVAIGLPAMVILALCAHFALSLFGASYAAMGTVPLWLMIASYLPGLPKAQYIAVSRATGKVSRAALVVSIMALFELAGVIAGGKLGGLNGLSFMTLGITLVEGAVTAPTVFRAATARGQARKAATAGFPALADEILATGSFPAISDRDPRQRQQERGLAALLGLASAAVAEGHSLDVAAEVWRTGELPVLMMPTAAGRHRRPAPPTSLDMFGNNRIKSQERVNYRVQQQAGLDALMAIATPVLRNEKPAHRDTSDEAPRVTSEESDGRPVRP
jgi:O-antigen/teichoic acid export membrane protein